MWIVWQTIHMKCQHLFSTKNNNTNYLKSAAAVMIGAFESRYDIWDAWNYF